MTGDRFLELLEAKLTLDLQNGSLPHDSSSSLFRKSNTNSAPSTHPNPTPIPAQAFPSSTPASAFHPSFSQYPSGRVQPSDQLAIEKVLHDYRQVRVPPDWVAPAIPRWDAQNPGNGAFEAELPRADLSSLPFDPVSIIRSPFPPDGTLASHPLTQTSALPNPSVPPSTMWDLRTSLPAPAPEHKTLPPVLKIHVHDPPVPSTSMDAHIHTPGPNTLPGAWALDLLQSSTLQKNDQLLWGHPPALAPSPASTQKQNHPTPPLLAAHTGLPDPRTRSCALEKDKGKRRAEQHQTHKRRMSESGGEGEAEAEWEGEGERKIIIACYTCRARKLK